MINWTLDAFKANGSLLLSFDDSCQELGVIYDKFGQLMHSRANGTVSCCLLMVSVKDLL